MSSWRRTRRRPPALWPTILRLCIFRAASSDALSGCCDAPPVLCPRRPRLPLLIREGAAQPLGGVGTLLGFFGNDELRLSEEQLALAAGDRLVLYTDGLTDVLDEQDQRFDFEQLQSIVLAHARLGADDLCAATFADLAAYQGAAEQYDHMTMLVMAVG